MSDTDQQSDPILDLPINDATLLWRRVFADKKAFDRNLGRWRPSSDSFSDNPRDRSSMSVYDAEHCGGLEAVMAGHDGFLLCSFTAGFARSLGLSVVRTAKGGPGHCEVVGEKKKRVKDRLAKECEWVIEPSDPRPH